MLPIRMTTLIHAAVGRHRSPRSVQDGPVIAVRSIRRRVVGVFRPPIPQQAGRLTCAGRHRLVAVLIGLAALGEAMQRLIQRGADRIAAHLKLARWRGRRRLTLADGDNLSVDLVQGPLRISVRSVYDRPNKKTRQNPRSLPPSHDQPSRCSSLQGTRHGTSEPVRRQVQND